MKAVVVCAGKRFGSFTVEKRERNGANTSWRCVCDCGNVRILNHNQLRTGNRPECECRLDNGSPDNRTREAYEKLLGRVATICNLPEKDIRGRSRIPVLNAARTVIAVTLRDEGFSMPQIGKAMNRNHTCVLRATRIKDPLGRLAGLLKREDLRTIAESLSRWRDQIAEDMKEVLDTNDRDVFDRAVARLLTLPEDQRATYWEASCRFMFPHSWKYQAASLPRACV